DDSVSVDEDTTLNSTVAGNDSTTSGGTLSYALATDASNGSLTLNTDGSFTYTPAADYHGGDSFTYTVTDSVSGESATRTVSLTINPVDDAVTMSGDTSGTGNEDTVISGMLTASDSADGLTDGTYFTVSTDATNGTASIDPETGLWSYTPSADFNGSDSFTVTVTDDDGYTDTQVINVTVTPVVDIVDDSLITNEETAISANVLTGTNGASADGFEGTPTLTGVTNGSNGSVSFLPDGTITYTPDANFNGNDSFTYTITSGGVTETGTVNVTVNAVTDLTAQDDSVSVDEDTTLNSTVAGNDSTTSGGTLSYALATDVSNGSLTLNTDGSFTYTPAADYHGADSFTYTVTDSASGESATQTVSITVNPINDTAVFSGDTSGSGDEDTVISGSLSVADTADGMTSPNYTV
ncbi:Ig-like domain-containing protein, partial [Marinobacter sp. F4216]|uniref:Ig-like domain-containing protein n=1 Tax=Marinobacter sp. F4216 TaxID=2874281 RepID=UPI001CBCCA37